MRLLGRLLVSLYEEEFILTSIRNDLRCRTRQEEIRIKDMREREYSAANNFTMPSSTLRSTRQIENTSEINNEFTEFITTTSYYTKDVSNDTTSQNFTVNC